MILFNCVCCAGTLVIYLFVLIDALKFIEACLTAVFFFAGIIVRKDVRTASHLHAAAVSGGSIMVGALAAGVAVTSKPICHE